MTPQEITDAMKKCKQKTNMTITLLFLFFVLAIYLANYYFIQTGASTININYSNFIILVVTMYTLIGTVCHYFEKVLIRLFTDKNEL